MVMGNRVSTESYQEIYGEGETFGVEKYLGFVDLAIKPHFNSLDWPNNREQKLIAITKNYQSTLYGLSDTSAIAVDAGIIEIVDGVKL
jgi:hypothetical protein